MLEKHVILLAYYFPPLTGIAGERAASLSGHLAALGWGPTVITPSRGFYHRTSTWEASGVRVVRTRSVELSRIIRGIYSRGQGGDDGGTIRAAEIGRVGESARRFVRDFVYIPDAQIGWIP